ncbi:MAG: hypothetical protein M1371_00870 [Actinobacteria bacterium]|nr:hypothetical protein [Actinomycetota bacterium]
MEYNQEKYILTVKGPIRPDDLGVTDTHNHVWVQRVGNYTFNSSLIIDDFQLIKRELIKYRDAGGYSVIDCQPGGCGRNGNKLYQLSKDTGVNIIAVTGFHKREFYPSSSPIWKMNKRQAANFFIEEIEIGLNETLNSGNNIKAGLIKIAFIDKLEEKYLILTEAAIQAALATNVSIMAHTERGRNVETLITFFEVQGIPLSRVMLCHMDKRNDAKLHKLLADKSLYLEYDTFLRKKYNPDENVWPLLTKMAEIGYHTNILIGSDMGELHMWRQNSQSGLAGFFTNIIKKMSEINIKKDAIDNMLRGNASNFLSIKK